MWQLICTTWFDDEYVFTYDTVEQCEQKVQRIQQHLKTWKIVNATTKDVVAEIEY